MNLNKLIKSRKLADIAGFTLIEILMVIVLIAILAGIAIFQFADFTPEAKNNTVKANLQILRRGIATQNAQMRLRCNVSNSAWPPATSLNANDITLGVGALCTAGQVTSVSDRPFVQGPIPPNPWGATSSNLITDCTVVASATACNRTKDCNDVAWAPAAAGQVGWCYNPGTGEVWANSANNGAGTKEYTY